MSVLVSTRNWLYRATKQEGEMGMIGLAKRNLEGHVSPAAAFAIERLIDAMVDASLERERLKAAARPWWRRIIG